MSKIVISALGVTQMQPTVYAFEDGSQISQPYFVRALAEKVEAEHVLMLMTKEALNTHWAMIEQAFISLPTTHLEEPVIIEMGATESEVWQNFDRLAKQIFNNDEIYFDVTNGFRSLPIIFMSAIRYFQQAIGVKVNGIYYGALEAVRRELQPKPVFRLDLFLKLGEWTEAVAAFKRSGETSLLSTLLKQYRFDQADLHRHFPLLTQHLTEFSQAVELNRSIDALDLAAKLTSNIDAFREEYERSQIPPEVFPEPFIELLNNVANECDSFAISRELLQKNYGQHLKCQLAFIHWCLNHDKIFQAITMSNEWLLSWAILMDGQSIKDIHQYYPRNQFRENKMKGQGENFSTTRLKDVITPSHLIALSTKLSVLRNDLAHCGMVAAPIQIRDIQVRVRGLIDQLDQLGATL